MSRNGNRLKRFATLEDVINHYSKGIKQHPNLDRRLRPATPVRRG